jgi:hypothetical protein
MKQQFVMPQRTVTAMPRSVTPPPLWLVRPRSDGGSDYVSFQPSQGAVEMLEGSHLPPRCPCSSGAVRWRSRRPKPAAADCNRKRDITAVNRFFSLASIRSMA